LTTEDGEPFKGFRGLLWIGEAGEMRVSLIGDDGKLITDFGELFLIADDAGMRF
jgi:hypothetical protein